LPPIAGGRAILAVGRFDAVKGMEDLMALLPRLRSPAWTATLVGDGWCLPQTRELAQRLGLADRVNFTGQLGPEALDRHFAAATLVVVPSRIPEAFGLTGIEAMAFAKPVVGYDRGGIRDWLRDGETGFLVPPGNIDTMAQCIDRLLDDPELAVRLGNAGRARVEQEFRPSRHLRALDEIYRRVCAARDD
jgi:glycosyltransferase involved in cell wall biosynthesis